MTLSIKSIKSHFPIFTHQPELVYLDNAATSQKPKAVIQTITDFYEKENANIHRGLYELSAKATQRYEGVRKKVSELIGADDPMSIAFTKGTTESINIVAQGFLKRNLTKGDNVVISIMEHHANLIPWQQVCAACGAELRVIPINEEGDLMLDKIASFLSNKTKLVALTHISNVLGTINPIEDVIAIAHKKNIPILIDGAQSVGHIPIDVKKLNLDFLVFSAHKMFGPLGVGVLYCKNELASLMHPFNFGGGSIKDVELDHTEFMNYPANQEAGTANIVGVIGLGAAIDFIRSMDLNETEAHVKSLTTNFKEGLKSVGKIRVMGNPKKSGGIVPFNVENIHPHDVAGFLANSSIAIRAGHHCAQPLHKAMNIGSSARVSFSVYNTKEDVDKTIAALVELKKFWW